MMRIINISMLALALASRAFAGDLEDGLKFFRSSDYDSAAKSFRKAAEQGVADAQLYLGRMYDDGQGVTQNYQQAAAWYRKAAEQGHAVAQSRMGIMYDKGRGVARNEKLAVSWFRKAAAQGYAEGQT